MTMNIDGIDVCEPILQLVSLLSNDGFKIINKRVSDYHFREVSITLHGKKIEEIRYVNINGIKKVRDDVFTCDCHWSSVKIVEVE
jgi:hypothetical protein